MSDILTLTKPLRVLVVEDDDVDFMTIRTLFSEMTPGEFKVERANSFDGGRDEIALKRHELYNFGLISRSSGRIGGDFIAAAACT